MIAEKDILATARKIADDLRLQWALRRRGDKRRLRPDEIKIMERAEQEIDALVVKRIKALLKRGTPT